MANKIVKGTKGIFDGVFVSYHKQETPEDFKEIIGKTLVDIKYIEGYENILLIFSDGFELEISAEGSFDFIVEINKEGD